MRAKWLPDAALDPHPRLTWLIECCFDLTVLALYRKEEMLPTGYRLDPGTLLVSNHQRDSDIPILTTVVCRREGFNIRFPLPFYATREDLFRPRFLRNLLLDAAWPAPLASLLGHIPLQWLFRIVRAQPMRRLREFSFGETLESLREAGLGDRTPQTLLRTATLQSIEAHLGYVPQTLDELSAARLGGLRSQFWGLRRLKLTAVRTLEAPFRAAIGAQLRNFAALLDAGRIVYLAPEGTISDTGRMCRLRRGAAQVIDLAQQSPAVRPAALSYDPLGTGRLRVVVRVGDVLEMPDPSDTRRFNATMHEAILGLCAVTPSHLLSRYLVAGPPQFTTATFAEWLADAIEQLNHAGLTVDPIFSRSDPGELARTRLRWLARRGLVHDREGHWHNRWPPDTPPGWHKPSREVAYLDAALGEVLSLKPGLDAELCP